MRRSLMVVGFGALLVFGWSGPVGAQQNGIVIQNNGVDSSNSAAGADNVRIVNNPGNAQSASGGGVNNENVVADRETKKRDRGERRTANATQAGGEAAPVEAAAAPSELQGFTDGGEYVEPVAAPAEIAQPAEPETVALQLPNTGTGAAQSTLLAGLAIVGSVTAGAASLRGRLAG